MKQRRSPSPTAESMFFLSTACCFSNFLVHRDHSKSLLKYYRYSDPVGHGSDLRICISNKLGDRNGGKEMLLVE